MEIINKNKWQVRIAVLIIFVLGFIAGALTLNLYHLHYSTASSTRGMHHHFERIIERLNLTQEQRVEVEKIFADAREQFQQAHKEVQPKFEEIRKQVDERLRTVLTPEQLDQFHQMMKEERSKWEERKKRFGPEDAPKDEPPKP